MRIAVVGGGISGLGAAWLISKDPDHQVVLFEREERLGGHAHTHKVVLDGNAYHVDTGFAAFNEDHYPLFKRLLHELGVATQPIEMGLAVHDGRADLEYNASSFMGLMARPRNLLDQRFLKMVGEIKRFNKEAPHVLEAEGPGPLLGEYLRTQNYSPMFIDNYLGPMLSTLWYATPSQLFELPAKYLIRYLRNHKLLQTSGRPQWRSVIGGSARYIEEMRKGWKVDERINTPALKIIREDESVRIATKLGEERFDQVVLACHSDQALRLLADPTEAESRILGAMPYQESEVVLHTDARLLPRRKRAWAACNAYVPPTPANACQLSFCMNIVQKLDAPEPIIVSMNRGNEIDATKVIARMTYQHPTYTRASIDAQVQRVKINGQRRTWFSGAYWRNGSHEDGLRTAVSVAKALDVEWHQH